MKTRDLLEALQRLKLVEEEEDGDEVWVNVDAAPAEEPVNEPEPEPVEIEDPNWDAATATYTFDGNKIPWELRPLIKVIEFADDYDYTMPYHYRDGGTRDLISIPTAAFKGCKRLEDVYLPDSIQMIGVHAFIDTNDGVRIHSSRKDRPVKVPGMDADFIEKHIVYNDVN